MPTIAELRAANPWADEISDLELLDLRAQQTGASIQDAAKAFGYDLPKSNASANLQSGLHSYASGLASIPAALGSDSAQAFADSERRKSELYDSLSTSPKSWDEVHNFGDAVGYAGRLGAQSLPYAAEFLATAGLGGVAMRGTRAAIRAAETAGDVTAATAARATLSRGSTAAGVAGSYPSSVGDILSNQYDQAGQYDLGNAVVGGIPYAALNAVGIEGLATRGLTRGLGEGLTKSRLANAAIMGGVVGTSEGLSETGQEVFNQYGRNAVDASYDPFGDEASRAYKESFIGGALLGGIPGGAGGFIQSKRQPVGDNDNLIQREKDNAVTQNLQQIDTNTFSTAQYDGAMDRMSLEREWNTAAQDHQNQLYDAAMQQLQSQNLGQSVDILRTQAEGNQRQLFPGITGQTTPELGQAADYYAAILIQRARAGDENALEILSHPAANQPDVLVNAARDYLLTLQQEQTPFSLQSGVQGQLDLQVPETGTVVPKRGKPVQAGLDLGEGGLPTDRIRSERGRKLADQLNALYNAGAMDESTYQEHVNELTSPNAARRHNKIQADLNAYGRVTPQTTTYGAVKRAERRAAEAQMARDIAVTDGLVAAGDMKRAADRRKGNLEKAIVMASEKNQNGVARPAEVRRIFRDMGENPAWSNEEGDFVRGKFEETRTLSKLHKSLPNEGGNFGIKERKVGKAGKPVRARMTVQEKVTKDLMLSFNRALTKDEVAARQTVARTEQEVPVVKNRKQPVLAAAGAQRNLFNNPIGTKKGTEKPVKPVPAPAPKPVAKKEPTVAKKETVAKAKKAEHPEADNVRRMIDRAYEKERFGVTELGELSDLVAKNTDESIMEAKVRLAGYARRDGGIRAAQETTNDTNQAPGRIMVNPSKEVSDDIQFLEGKLDKDGRTGATVQAYEVPDALNAYVRAVEKLGKVRVRFVSVDGISGKAGFAGIYTGRNVLFVNVRARKPASFIIGHEFLHYLKNADPELFDRFTQAAMPLLKIKQAKDAAVEAGKYYDKYDEADQTELGWEEVYADTFGDAWADPNFWQALADQNLNLAQRALRFLKKVVNQITATLRSENHTPVTKELYKDFDAITNLVLAATNEFVRRDGNPYVEDASDIKYSAATATMNEVGAALSDGLTDGFGKIRRGGLATMMLNHIQEIYGKELPAIQQYDDAVRKMGSTARAYTSEGKAIMDTWQNLPTEQFKTVSNLLIDTTLDKVWPNKAWDSEENSHLHSEDPKELAKNRSLFDKAVAAYKGLGKDGQASYNKVIGLTTDWLRKEFELRNSAIRSTYLPEIVAASGELKGKLEDILKADNTPREERSKVTELLRNNKPTMELVRSMYNEIEDNGALLREIKGPYFPLMRFGEHLVVARSKEFMDAQQKLDEVTNTFQAFRENDEGIKKLDELREELANLRREYYKRPSKIKQDAIKATQGQISALRKELKETSIGELDDLRREMLVARKTIKALESDPKSYIMEKFESEAQAKRRRDELLGDFEKGQVYTGMASMWDKHISSASKGFMTKLEQRIGQTLGADQAGKAVTALRSVFMESLHDQSSLRRQAMRRREIAGYSTDSLRVFASYIGQSSHKLANIEHFVGTQDALDQVRDQAKKKMVAGDDKLQEVSNEISKRFAMGLEYTETPIQNAIAGFTHVMTLGMSPAYLLQQVAQTPMITIPLLAAHKGVGAAKATSLTWNALKDAWRIVKSSMDKSGSKMHYDVDFNDSSLTQGEKDLMKFLFEQGRIDILMEHDIGEIAQGKQKSLYSKFLGYSNWAARQIEITNRLVTGLAAYRAVVAQEGHDKAQRYASKIIADSQVDYSNENAPRVMKHNAFFGAKLIMQFKKYQVAMATMVMRNAYQALKATDPTERAEARKILGGLFTTHFLMAGTLGLPIAAPIGLMATLISWAWPDDDEPDPETAYKNFLADLLGQDAADVVARGLPAAFGLDFSKRVGMGSLFNPVPFVRTDKQGKEQFNELVLSLLGPSVGVGGRLWDGVDKLTDGDLVGAWGLMAPKYIADPMKGLMLGVEGITTKDGNTRVGADQFDVADQIMRGLGIPLLEAQKYYERNAAFEDAKSSANEIRTRLMKDWNKAEDKTEAMAQIADFNSRHPTDKITRSNLLAHRKSAQNYAKGINEQGLRVGKKDGEFAATVRFKDGGYVDSDTVESSEKALEEERKRLEEETRRQQEEAMRNRQTAKANSQQQSMSVDPSSFAGSATESGGASGAAAPSEGSGLTSGATLENGGAMANGTESSVATSGGASGGFDWASVGMGGNAGAATYAGAAGGAIAGYMAGRKNYETDPNMSNHKDGYGDHHKDYRAEVGGGVLGGVMGYYGGPIGAALAYPAVREAHKFMEPATRKVINVGDKVGGSGGALAVDPIGTIASGKYSWGDLAKGAVLGPAKKWFGLAGGGHVTGPGTATSDSIPARLSNGEYVLNAEAVKMVGKDTLDKINARGLAKRRGK